MFALRKMDGIFKACCNNILTYSFINSFLIRMFDGTMMNGLCYIWDATYLGKN